MLVNLTFLRLILLDLIEKESSKTYTLKFLIRYKECVLLYHLKSIV